jgi:folate-binding protein YgfZ
MKALPLSHIDFVQITGPESKKFLQGQVSCNMDLLSPEKSLSGALCNLKGRVIADFRAIQAGDAIWLQTEIGMGQHLIDVLAKYIVFSKAEISLVSLAGKVIGLFSENGDESFAGLLDDLSLESLPDQDNAAVCREDCIVIKLPAAQSRYQVISLSENTEALLAKILMQAESATEAEWDMLDIEMGIVHIHQQDSEQFTPQLLNYDVSGVIDFKKGCYTGQEIVARMFYRTTAKKRLYLLSSSTRVSATDSVIYNEEGVEKTAEILRCSDALVSPTKTLILAILGTQAMNSDSPPRLSQASTGEAIAPDTAPTINSESFLKFLTLPYTK